jgi:hypothetical protein
LIGSLRVFPHLLKKRKRRKERKEEKETLTASDSYNYGTSEPSESLLIFSTWGISGTAHNFLTKSPVSALLPPA